MTPETITRDEDTRSSAEIESEIRQTRSRMDATLDELGNRLTPRSLLNSAFDWWESPDPHSQGSVAVKKAVVTIARQARLHPMPALLIGSGIAWLVADSMDHDDEDEREGKTEVTLTRTRSRSRFSGAGSKASNKVAKAKEVASNAKDAATGAIETVKEKASAMKEKASEMGEKLHQTSDRISDQAHEALESSKTTVRKVKGDIKESYQMGTEKLEQAMDEYPLAVGLGFAALGALVGLVIPRTQRENELMGEQSDQLVQETKEKAEELLETGKVVGERVLERVKEEAREQGLTGDRVAGTMSELANKGTQIAQKAKDEAMQAAEEQGLKQPENSQQLTESERQTVGSGNCGC